MNTELIVLYTQMDKMEQTKEIVQLKAHVRERLYQDFRHNMTGVIGLGRILGYDELLREFQEATQFLEKLKSGELK